MQSVDWKSSLRTVMAPVICDKDIPFQSRVESCTVSLTFSKVLSDMSCFSTVTNSLIQAASGRISTVIQGECLITVRQFICFNKEVRQRV